MTVDVDNLRADGTIKVKLLHHAIRLCTRPTGAVSSLIAVQCWVVTAAYPIFFVSPPPPRVWLRHDRAEPIFDSTAHRCTQEVHWRAEKKWGR